MFDQILVTNFFFKKILFFLCQSMWHLQLLLVYNWFLYIFLLDFNKWFCNSKPYRSRNKLMMYNCSKDTETPISYRHSFMPLKRPYLSKNKMKNWWKMKNSLTNFLKVAALRETWNQLSLAQTATTFTTGFFVGLAVGRHKWKFNFFRRSCFGFLFAKQSLCFMALGLQFIW